MLLKQKKNHKLSSKIHIPKLDKCFEDHKFFVKLRKVLITQCIINNTTINIYIYIALSLLSLPAKTAEDVSITYRANHKF